MTVKLVQGPVPFPYKWYQARAYTDGDEVHYEDARWPDFETLIWHELEHARDPAFTNETHHPWWHWCIRAKVPFRLRYHAEKSTIEEARKLIRDGQL